MGKIVVVGSLNRDIVMQVPHIPEPGETILCSSIDYFNGGKGANQATAIARLGGTVSMIGCVGADDAGDALIKSLSEAGVDTASIEQSPTVGTGSAYISVSEEGQNSIIVYPGANSLVSPKTLSKFHSVLTGASYCVVQMEVPVATVEAVCRICNALGVKVLLNPAPAQTIDSSIFPLIEYIVPNETELQILVNEQGSYEELAQKLYKKGVKHVIVTLGEEGCMLVDKNGVSSFPAVKVKCVDTTAAGDAFIGGFIVGISEGLPISLSIEFANKAAGFAITRKGAQASLGSRAELDAFFK